jgi:hypothetical protein
VSLTKRCFPESELGAEAAAAVVVSTSETVGTAGEPE